MLSVDGEAAVAAGAAFGASWADMSFLISGGSTGLGGVDFVVEASGPGLVAGSVEAQPQANRVNMLNDAVRTIRFCFFMGLSL
jgi:hypothetical protein